MKTDLKTGILLAVNEGDDVKVENFLRIGVDPNFEEGKLLGIAIRRNHLSTVKLLLEKGARFNLKTTKTTLHTIVHSKNREMLEVLLTIPEVNIQSTKDEILKEAADIADNDTIEYIIQRGANVYAEKAKPLLYALDSGNTSTIKLILSHGDFKKEAHEIYFWALCALGKTEKAKTLLKKHPRLIHPGSEAIAFATKYGNEKTLEFLLQHEKISTTTNKNEALEDSAERGYINITKLLLAHNAQPWANKRTALQHAVKNKHERIVELHIRSFPTPELVTISTETESPYIPYKLAHAEIQQRHARTAKNRKELEPEITL